MKHSHRWGMIALAAVAMATAFALVASGGQRSLAQAETIYVDADATGANNGSSWEDAHTTLQPALDGAQDGDEIWVAAGTYTPTWEFSPGDPRSATFQLKNGVALNGGFDPTVGDTGWEDRDWESNVTVLSGDIGTQGDPADNSYHVFYHPPELALNGSAVLDGFTVTSGNANAESSPNDTGGGMFNSGSSPALSNCTFSDNSAGNAGGGMYNLYDSSPAVTNCTFSGNSADAIGGGMANLWSSSPVVTNCTFSDNSVLGGGGAMINIDSSPEVMNCAFSHNSAGDAGAGMFNVNFSSPVVTNCTFSGNWAQSGGAMENNSSSPTVTNCILWEDSPEEISSQNSQPVVTYSDIQGGYEGAGNIDADPLFVNPDSGDFHVGPGSPCIDAATNDAPDLPDYDFEDNPRVTDGNGDGTAAADMGIDEAWVVYVDLEARGADDGTSWEDAHIDLQGAQDEATEGAWIWVAAGTYRPTYEFSPGDPRSATFQLKNGVALYGGFDPSVGDTGWEDRDWVGNVVTLSGNIGTVSDPADNSYHVFYHPPELALDATAILDGFTVSGGKADAESGPNLRGGGMYNGSSSPSVTNCTFSDNAAHLGGGMANSSSSSPSVTNCTFFGNSALTGAAWGGAMFNYDHSSPRVTNCTFRGNQAGVGGGMYNMASSSPTVTNCTFSGNWESGMVNRASSPSVINCVLWGDFPGEISNDAGAPVVTYSDVQGIDLYPGDGNINVDPLFVDPDSGNYHLRPGSSCIDAGTNDAPNLPKFDFEGHPRVVDGDNDGVAVVDMGVDEVFRVRVYLPLIFRSY